MTGGLIARGAWVAGGGYAVVAFAVVVARGASGWLVDLWDRVSTAKCLQEDGAPVGATVTEPKSGPRLADAVFVFFGTARNRPTLRTAMRPARSTSR
ncbi:MAG: hypothetical protein AAF914_12995 [Pseudomonadota bacterium]